MEQNQGKMNEMRHKRNEIAKNLCLAQALAVVFLPCEPLQSCQIFLGKALKGSFWSVLNLERLQPYSQILD